MRKSLLSILLGSLCLLPFSMQVHAEQYQAAPLSASPKKVPPLTERFPSVNPKAYQVPVYHGPFAKDISDRHHSFRTYLRRALKGGQVNFGGHYILAMPGCGTSCLSPILVDVKTGRVYDLDIAPFTGFMDSGEEMVFSDMDIQYAEDSTLLYFAGSMGEYGTGSFLLDFKNGRFSILKYSNTVQYNVDGE